ncbi:MAG: hypothetical protein P8P30_02210 [Rickettsiales bacterium]|nr:hypothetical protein [Rickettsiales bacterium]
MVETQEWVLCPQPEIGDTLRWNEPIWASPNKPRGKPDKIGEQEIIAQLIGIEGFLEFTVISVKKLGAGEAPLKVKENDTIRRKKSTLEQGDCHKSSG